MIDQHTATLADEILKLESVHQSSGLNDNQLRKWRELVCLLLLRICPKNERRRDLRIPAEVPTSIRRGNELVTGTIVDVHRSGVAVRGDFANWSEGDAIAFESFRAGEATHYSRVSGTIARKETIDGSLVVGVALDVSADAQKRFFDIVFYPAYLDYLKHLAKS